MRLPRNACLILGTLLIVVPVALCLCAGPSFAKEVMMGRPTGIVAASKVCAAALLTESETIPEHCMLRYRCLPQLLASQPTQLSRQCVQDKALARTVQRLFASPSMRVNTTTGGH